MDHLIKISSDGMTIIANADGKLDETAYLLIRNKIVELIKNCNAKNMLLDIRNAVVKASVMEIYSVASSSVEMFPLGFRYAIVYSEITMSEKDALFGETVVRNRGGQLKVFKDISEAHEWLAISNPQSE
jgi:hypothetical protein